MSFPFQFSGYDRPNFGGTTSWDFTEGFTDDQTTLDARWGNTGSVTKPNATNDNFNWTGIRNGANYAMSYSPTTVSDTAFVVQAEITIAEITTGSYSAYFSFGLASSGHATGATTARDCILLATRARGASEQKWYFTSKDGAAWTQPTDNVFTNAPSVATFGYRIIRTSSTTMIGYVFDTPWSSELENSGSVACASTTAGLDHILFQNDNISTITTNFTGTGDNVKLASGVTVPPS
jgi:hypothetical protein